MNATLPARPNRRLTDALDAVYRTFAMRPPASVAGCPCCIETRRIDVLLTTPLRQITGQALWRYVSGAFLTVGDLNDFRYLLPRILDVSVSDPGNANNPEIVLGKLSLAGWRSWAADEQRAIGSFIEAWFEQAIESDLAEADEGWIGWESESLLCGAGRAGLPVDRLLPRLGLPDAAPVVADMRARLPTSPSGFWEDVPSAFREVRSFLDQRPI